MTLTDLVEQMETEGRLPKVAIDAHRQTLQALVALAQRIEALEAFKPTMRELYGEVRPRGRPRKEA